MEPEDAELPLGKQVRFWSKITVLPPKMEVDPRGLPRLSTKRMSLNLSRPKYKTSSLSSPANEKPDPFIKLRRHDADDHECGQETFLWSEAVHLTSNSDSFIPDPPKQLTLKMPTITRRPPATKSDEVRAPSCLKRNNSPKRTTRDPNAERCPVIQDVADLPPHSTSITYRPTAPSSPTSPRFDNLESLHDCCLKCFPSYQYGLMPASTYRECFSASAKRKRARDLQESQRTVPGESPILHAAHEEDAPVMELQATLVDELARLRPEIESAGPAARRASLGEIQPLPDTASATESDRGTDGDQESFSTDDDDEEDDEEEDIPLTAPLRRTTASFSTGPPPQAEVHPTVNFGGVPPPPHLDHRTAPMQRRGKSLSALPYTGGGSTVRLSPLPEDDSTGPLSKQSTNDASFASTTNTLLGRISDASTDTVSPVSPPLTAQWTGAMRRPATAPIRPKAATAPIRSSHATFRPAPTPNTGSQSKEPAAVKDTHDHKKPTFTKRLSGFFSSSGNATVKSVS